MLWAIIPLIAILFSLAVVAAPAHASQKKMPTYPICNGDACDFVYPAAGYYANSPFTDCQNPTRVDSVAMVDDHGVTDGHLYLYVDTYTGTGSCYKDVWGTVSLNGSIYWPPNVNLQVFTTRTNTTDDALDQNTYYEQADGPGNYMDGQLAGYDTESPKDCFNSAVDWTAPDGHAEHTQTAHNGYCP